MSARQRIRQITKLSVKLFVSIATLMVVFVATPAQAASAAPVPQPAAASFLLAADPCKAGQLPTPDAPCDLTLDNIPKSANYNAISGFWPILGAIITVLAAVSIILGFIGMPVGFICGLFGGKDSKAHKKGAEIKAASLQLAMYGIGGVIVMQLLFKMASTVLSVV